MNALTNQITIAATAIRQDPEGRYCLNDLHKAAGGESRHRPNYFLDRVEVDDLRYELKKEYEASAGIPAMLSINGGPQRGNLRSKGAGLRLCHVDKPQVPPPSDPCL